MYSVSTVAYKFATQIADSLICSAPRQLKGSPMSFIMFDFVYCSEILIAIKKSGLPALQNQQTLVSCLPYLVGSTWVTPGVLSLIPIVGTCPAVDTSRISLCCIKTSYYSSKHTSTNWLEESLILTQGHLNRIKSESKSVFYDQ